MRTRADELHTHQNLAGFAMIEAPLSQKIGRATVAEFVSDLEAYFDPEAGELPWTSISLTSYVPPRNSWTDRFGAEHDFSGLAELLMQQAPEQQSCGGIHLLEAMVALLKADAEHELLREEVLKMADQWLSKMLGNVYAAQNRDGSWDLNCLEGPEPLTLPDAQQDRTKLIATGHMAELLTEIGSAHAIPKGLLKKAGAYLWARLCELERADESFLSNYCPWTHAACAVARLRK